MKKARNRNNWPGNRGEMKIPGNTTRTRCDYTSNNRSLVDFKNALIMGLYDAELKKTACFSCLRS